MFSLLVYIRDFALTSDSLSTIVYQKKVFVHKRISVVLSVRLFYIRLAFFLFVILILIGQVVLDFDVNA